MYTPARFPFWYVPDQSASRPVFNGKMYFGIPDTDPTVIANQIDVYMQEEDGTMTLLPQPIMTGAGGIPMFSGNAIQLFVEQEYSLAVLNSLDVQIFYAPKVLFNDVYSSNIDNIDSLRSITPSFDYQVINVLGYYTPGDNKINSYVYMPLLMTDDNGGSIIRPDSIPTDQPGRYFFASAKTPKDFGAKGDGVTVDTDAIKAALDYCYSLRQNSFDTAELHFTNGIYIVDEEINIPSYMTVTGEGWNSVIKVKDNCTSAFSVFKFDTSSANNMLISHLAIHGNSANNTQIINGIEISPVSPIYYNQFNCLYIKEMSGNGVKITGGGAERVQFNFCIIRDCKRDNIYSEYLRYSDINNCLIRTAKTGYSGIRLNGSGNYSVNINNCQIEENASYGISVTGAEVIGVQNNKILNNTGAGIYAGTTNTLSIKDNFIVGNDSYGCLIEGASGNLIYRLKISGNQVYGNNLHGVYLDYIGSGAVRDNYFVNNSAASSNTYSGVYLSRSSNVDIQENTYEGTSQKYAVDFGASITNNTIKENHIISVGTDYLPSSVMNSTNKIKITREGIDSASPTTGSWNSGDIVWNKTPTSAGYIGWVCTVGGTPGTWKEFGLIS